MQILLVIGNPVVGKKKVMSFFKMGNRFKHRSFEYIPQFYDPVKEELQQRIKGYNEETDATEIAKSRIRGGFKGGGVDTRQYSSQIRRRSNFRLLAIIAVLIILTIFFIQRYLPEIQSYLD